MKKDLLAKALLGLATTSILVESCTNESMWIDSDEYLNPQFNDEGALAVALTLSAEEAKYVNFLNKLATDIVKEPEVARQFANDPKAYLEQYGFKDNINLDDGMLKLILALGDEDINTALNQNDVTTVLALMESKGILNDISKSDLKVKISDEELKKLYEGLGIDVDEQFIQDKKYGSGVVAAAVVAYVAVLVVSWAGVAYNAAAAVNAAVWLAVYTWIEAWGQSQNINEAVEQNLPLKIWSLKGQNENTIIAADKYLSQQSRQIVRLIKKHEPQLLKHVDEKQLEQLVKINYIQIKK